MAERKPKAKLIPIKTNEDLLRVVMDVVDTQESIAIDIEDVGRVTISPERGSQPTGLRKSHEDIEARQNKDFEAAFGSWANVDADALKAEIKSARSQKARPWMLGPAEQ